MSKFFCLTVPKNLVGEPFCFSVMFWYQKKFWTLGVSFFSKNFCFIRPKKLVGNPSMFQKVSGMGNFMDKSGGPLFTIGNFLSHSAENYRAGTICFRKFPVQKVKYGSEEGGGITFCRRKFLVSHRQKTSSGNHSMFQEDSAMRKIMDKKRGTPFFPSEINCLRVPKKCGGTLRCFRESRLPKKFMNKKREGRSFTISIENF